MFTRDQKGPLDEGLTSTPHLCVCVCVCVVYVRVSSLSLPESYATNPAQNEHLDDEQRGPLNNVWKGSKVLSCKFLLTRAQRGPLDEGMTSTPHTEPQSLSRRSLWMEGRMPGATNASSSCRARHVPKLTSCQLS